MKAGQKASRMGRNLFLALGLGAVLLAISFLPLPNQAANERLSVQAWGYRYDDRDPQIAVDAVTGDSYVVWERYSPFLADDVDIFWRHVNPDGTLGVVLNLSDPSDPYVPFYDLELDNGLNEYRPRIDLDDLGNSYVVWYGQTQGPRDIYPTWVDEDFEIFWQRVATDGTTVLEFDPISGHLPPVTDNDLDDRNPEIVVDRVDNSSVIVWRGWRANDWDLGWARLTEVGSHTASSPRYVTANGQDDRNPSIGIDVDGYTYIVWESQSQIRRGDYDIYWQSLGPDGSFRSFVNLTETRQPSEWRTQEDAPEIAVGLLPPGQGDPATLSFVVWQGRRGPQWDIFWRMVSTPATDAARVVSTVLNECRVDPWGRILESCNLTSDYTTGERYSDSFPHVALDGSGNSYVVWEGNDYRDTDIYFRRVSFDGTASGVFNVSDFPGHYYQNDHTPQIAVDYEGNSYIVWQGENGYGEEEIFWRRVNANLTFGPVLNITDNRVHPDRVPVVGVNRFTGDSMVAYQGWDGVSWAVWWQKIDAFFEQTPTATPMSDPLALFPTPTPVATPIIP